MDPKFKQYVDTHIHSQYSLLDGVSSPAENVARAKALGMSALAISDHGTVAGVHEFYTAAKKAGLLPLCGNELYLKEKLKDGDKDRKYFHGVILAQNQIGFENLMYLSSVGFKEDHFEFRRPVVSFEELFAHSEGLVFSTGCMIGILGTAQHRQLSMEEADVLVAKFKAVFGERMFIEIGPAQVCMDFKAENPDAPSAQRKYGHIARETKEIVVNPETNHKIWTNCLQIEHNYRAVYFSEKYGIPLIIASDAHMAEPKLKAVQDLLMVSAPGNSNGFKFHQVHSMLTSADTWAEIQKHHSYISLAQYEQMIDNTFRIPDLCKGLKLDFAPMVPKFQLAKHPLYQKGMTPRQLMYAIIKVTGRMKNESKYVSRLQEEIKVICDNGITDYTEYFLILADMAKAAGDRHVGMGPARGSAGGCLLSYVLGITALDPLKWDLSFVRFLNSGRLGTPKLEFPEIPLGSDLWK